MELAIRILLAIYALLMILATWQDKTTTLKQLNYLTNVAAGLLLISTFLTWLQFVIVSIFSLVAFQVLAIIRGLQLKNFHWQHHLIRLIVTVIFIVLLFYI